MEEKEEPQTSPGLLARFFGVIFSPASTFARVTEDPRWLGILTLVTFLYAIPVATFMRSSVGQEAWLDQVTEGSRSWGREMSDQQLQTFEKIAPYAGYFAFVQMIIFIPVATLIVSGIGFAVFSAGLGGTATFKQAFAVVAHAGALAGFLQLFVWPLNYVREAMTSPTSLAALLPFVEEGTFAYRLLRATDLGLIWWVVVLAIGFAVLYRRSAASIAASFLGLYGAIALAIAAFTK